MIGDRNLYSVPDDLRQLCKTFSEIDASAQNGICVIKRHQVGAVISLLRILVQRSTENAHEISQHRWNALAREEAEARAAEQAQMERIMAEAERPGSNVVLLGFTSVPLR
ncbi:MAG: hypothetical protein DI629_03595 [Mesorhizobium amorphae]|nr:MAG: hypothetical protein DI629_03595 [Mesorhizobium amorphae]